MRQTYNVTVHRRKLHAVTQLPGTSMNQTPTHSSFSNSTSSRRSQDNDQASPHIRESRSRPNSMNDGRLLRNLTDDPTMIDALQLFYDEDPAHMFKNSPLRPEMGPRSASDGNMVNRSSTKLDETPMNDVSVASSAIPHIGDHSAASSGAEVAYADTPAIAPLNLSAPVAAR